MVVEDFWKRVDKELRKYDLLTHPFYQAWSAGELTAEELGFYGRQYLRHVAAFPTYLTALHARLPEGETRRAVLRNAAEEEVHGRSHADLWRQFVSGIEPGRDAKDEEVLPEVVELVESYRELGQTAPAAASLGAFYAYESQVPRIAGEKLAGLKKFYGADDRTCEYFRLHMTADIRHAHVWQSLIEEVMGQEQESETETLEGVRRGARALWRALDGIEAARQEMRGRVCVH
jgi:pyrroloquinoline-quinone synthase